MTGKADRANVAATEDIDLTRVDFHFDVMCPYAYQTSKWIRDVRSQNGLAINWRFFSLEEVNRVEGKKHPWERPWSYGWSLLRIAALLGRKGLSLDDGTDAVDAWYERSGRGLHEEGLRVHTPEVAKKLIAELGLDPLLVEEAMDDESTHDDVKADHQRVIDSGGYGVPTLFFNSGATTEHCLFGPVLVDPPTGDAAMRLWNAVTAWVEFPFLYELQQPKTKEDEQIIARSFDTYLNARDWVSINRGKVVDFTEDGFEVAGPAG